MYLLIMNKSKVQRILIGAKIMAGKSRKTIVEKTIPPISDRKQSKYV